MKIVKGFLLSGYYIDDKEKFEDLFICENNDNDLEKVYYGTNEKEVTENFNGNLEALEGLKITKWEHYNLLIPND
jgi:hypothetical protein